MARDANTLDKLTDSVQDTCFSEKSKCDAGARKPRIAKPAWHRQPCPDCERPLTFTRMGGVSFRPRDYDAKTAQWNYTWHAWCRCGFEASMTTRSGKLVYPEKVT